MHSEVRPNRMVGVVLGGVYQVTGLLAEGGMGWVYEARHLRLSKRVAVKLMARELAANPEALARFHREAEVTSQLGHPHLVSVLDFGLTADGEPFLVMEYLEGEDLERRIQRHQRLSLAATVAITRQIASALRATHAEGIIHRDLKPANVFLVRVPDEADFVKVLDFGISKIKAGRTKLTGATAVIGTPEYMAPEQANGLVEDIDHRVDQWALACITWEMLAGHSPFAADDIGAVFYRIINADPQPLSARVPDLPPTVEPVLRRALSKRPADRYPSIKEFAQAFVAAAIGMPVEATPVPLVSKADAGALPAPAESATLATRKVTQGYGEPKVAPPGSSALEMAMPESVAASGSQTSASTFEARVMSLLEADEIADAREDRTATRWRRAGIIVAAAIAVLLASAALAMRSRRITPTASPAPAVHVLPVVSTLPEPPPLRPVRPAALPISRVQSRAMTDVAPSFAARPTGNPRFVNSGAPPGGGHRGAPVPLSKPKVTPRPRPTVLAIPARRAVPLVPGRPESIDPSGPGQPSRPPLARSAAGAPSDTDPFEAPAAEPPTPAKQRGDIDPFEAD